MNSGSPAAAPAASVPVAAETAPVESGGADAADDPAIWVDPTGPTRGVIFGTDKRAGLYIYSLDGKVTGHIPDGRLNNVDLRENFPMPTGAQVLVAASDRGRGGAALYLLDPSSLTVAPWALLPLDLAEPYGLCLGRSGDRFILVVNGTDGEVRQLSIASSAEGALEAQLERRFDVGTQTEGCVIDDQHSFLYIGEEAAGIWRYDLDDPAAGRTLIAAAPSDALTPDVEGLAIMRDGQSAWLIASSQGDSAFAVWVIDGGDYSFAGRFRLVAANGVDEVTGTDGIEARGGPVGTFRRGVLIVQDDVDTDGESATTQRDRQNFKLVAWEDVARALGL